MRDTGGPAFPFPGVPTDGTGIDWEMPPFPGMTLHDFYAGLAMPGVMIQQIQLAKHGGPTHPASHIEDLCNELADAMIAGKRRREG